MSSILIDYANIIKANSLYLLEKHVQPIPETNYMLGLVLVVPDTQLNILESLPKGNGRVMYINNVNFVNSILGYAFLIYDDKKKICEIMGMKGIILNKVLENVLSNLPNDIILWIGISLDNEYFSDIALDYTKNGFTQPYVCKTSPLGFCFDTYGLCMLRENTIVDEQTIYEVKYVISQFRNSRNYCRMKLCLTPDTIKHFKQLSKMGSTHNINGDITQKEIAGKLYVNNIDKNLIHSLAIDKTSIMSGSEESVDIAGGLYNFHSHPQEAYHKYNVKLGWPSAQDYVGFLISIIEYETILHIVVSIEGFYVISLTEYWASNKKLLGEQTIDHISNSYNILYSNNMTTRWYINKVNSIGYGKYPLFRVEFFNWYDKDVVFEVCYCKSNINCFSRQNTYDNFRKLY